MNTASFRYVLARRKTEEAKVNPTLSLGHYVPSFSGGVSNGCASLLFAILSYCIAGKIITTTLSPHRISQNGNRMGSTRAMARNMAICSGRPTRR